MNKKIFINYWYGMVDYDKVSCVCRNEKAIFCETAGKTIKIFEGSSTETDKELRNEEIEQQVTNIEEWLNDAILDAYKSEEAVITISMSKLNYRYRELLKELDEEAERLMAEEDDED